MSVPVVSPASSVPSFNQWLFWQLQIVASGTPYDFRIDSGNVPPGMQFQPSSAVTGTALGSVINLSAQGYANGAQLVFRSLTGGSGLTTNTLYYVVNGATNTFQLATTPGGSPIAFTTDITAALLYQPGLLSGAATVPGVFSFTVFASNSSGESAAGVTFTVGIKPAAAVQDANCDLVWDFASNAVIAQTSSALSLTPAPRTTPIMFVKEQDDLILRLRTVKGGSILDLGAIANNACVLSLKELEGDSRVEISDLSVKVGTGDSNSILIHAKINGTQLAAALSNYESDTGTLFNALAEIQITYPNPGYFAGTPASLVRTTPTFTIQIERDLTQD